MNFWLGLNAWRDKVPVKGVPSLVFFLLTGESAHRSSLLGDRREYDSLPLPEVRLKPAILAKPQATIEVETRWRRLQGADPVAPCPCLQHTLLCLFSAAGVGQPYRPAQQRQTRHDRVRFGPRTSQRKLQSRGQTYRFYPGSR